MSKFKLQRPLGHPA